jgi:hypothetical protein
MYTALNREAGKTFPGLRVEGQDTKRGFLAKTGRGLR